MHNTSILIETLSENGLLKQEAEIYIALLVNGDMSLTEISQKTSLRRTTLYRFIKNLLSYSLISKSIHGKRSAYHAENPKQFLFNVHQKQRALQKIFPDMKRLYDDKTKTPTVQFFEGKRAIQLLYRRITQTKQRVRSIFSASAYWSVFTEKEGKQFLKDIHQGGGELRDLVENSLSGRMYVQNCRSGKIGKSKLLPEEFSFSSDIIIAGDEVAFISPYHLSGILIKNKNIADLQVRIFDSLWKNL